MNTSQEWCCIVLTMFAAVLGLQTMGVCKGDKPNFYATVQSQFPTWDLNHDDALSGNEILQAFENPKYIGQAAAAIAVLQQLETHHIGKNEPLESFRLNQLNQTENDAKPGHDKNQTRFLLILSRINAASPELFAHGVPRMDEITQGDTNECYFISVVAGLARARPQELAKLIEAKPDGTFTVHFFGTRPINVTRPTTAEISGYSSAIGDGIWLPVLMKAYGVLKLNTGWKSNDMTPVEEDPMEAAAIHKGHSAPVIALLTGHGANVFTPASIADVLRKKLTRAFDEHRIVIIGAHGHALTGIGYDRKSDQIQVWNPYGKSGNFKRWDIAMQNGIFALPISEFLEKCPKIVFEDPTKPPKVDNGHGGRLKHRGN
jgi:hypothetical protein